MGREHASRRAAVIDETLFEAEEKMDKAVSVAKEDFAGIRAGRATASLFDKIVAEYYGAPTPLTQMAGFQIQDARMVVISPYDKSSTAVIEKAIRESDLGVNPTNDGNVIRVAFPQLTEERRKEYIKVARHKAEDARIAIRSIRRHAKEALDKMAKDGDTGEDEVHRAEKSLQDSTDRYVASIDELLKHKEAELLEV
jgi:ribosome recycling factor